MGLILDQLSGKAFVALGAGGGGAFGVVGASLYQTYAQPHTCPAGQVLLQTSMGLSGHTFHFRHPGRCLLRSPYSPLGTPAMVSIASMTASKDASQLIAQAVHKCK